MLSCVYAIVKPLPHYGSFEDSSQYIEITKSGERVVGTRRVSGSELNRIQDINESEGPFIALVLCYGVTALGIALSGLWPTRDLPMKASTLGINPEAKQAPRSSDGQLSICLSLTLIPIGMALGVYAADELRMLYPRDVFAGFGASALVGVVLWTKPWKMLSARSSR